jgi:hypothetical protein
MPKIRKKLNLTIEQVLGRRGEAVRLPLTSYRTAFMRHEQGSTTIGYDVPCPTASTPTSNHEQRLQLSCLLDHDGQIPSSRAVCSGCADSHGRHLFARRETRKTQEVVSAWVVPDTYGFVPIGFSTMVKRRRQNCLHPSIRAETVFLSRLVASG